ncbi:hypothetical protein AK812_SmicGene8811 [Symbiodinium microadriaticum]|uniref:Uncharacterized protein n=1 Tax=Symbiodinium microadriaticum TaxID=2951 RepID=A0A1Q9EJY2_SYMMI|nr:hypothetical protein AK812_SmicGene8811 [Symbiodinium microadriaticum]CAE7027633.1 unnamed protein product [Symbiodinium sp. KB8]CAE7892747.1 unnamed protein product [Symbiodinium microadriaticum]
MHETSFIEDMLSEATPGLPLPIAKEAVGPLPLPPDSGVARRDTLPLPHKDIADNRFLQDALAESPQHPTPVHLSVQARYAGFTRLLTSLFPHSLWGQLLRELRLSTHIQRSRRQLTLLPPSDSVLCPTHPSETHIVTSDTTQGSSFLDQLLVNVSFVLLTPDYSHETLALDILVPQPLPEVLDLIDVCRDTTRKCLFPRLVSVSPQPDICWGTLLALPAWCDQTITVCLNTYALQGTLFAVTAPPTADRYRLLMLANLPLSTAVNIYRPHSSFPLSEGEEIHLSTGDCLTFCPPGNTPDPVLTLADMVQTHLPWSAGPPFPEPPGDRRYCVVSDQGYRGFKLLPERSMYYKADIAQLLHLRSPLLSLQPAQPAVHDAADSGWSCATAVAAGEGYRQESNDSESVGLLDCRPLPSSLDLDLAFSGTAQGMPTSQTPFQIEPFASPAYNNARAATRRLGFPWPRGRLGTEAPTQVHFTLLAPEYVQDLQLLFPVLWPVFPQPLHDCGSVLIVPDWPTERVIVCIDRTSIDGHLFAAHTLPLTDKHALLNLAGFSGAALLDVYIPHRQTPVDYGEDVWLVTGMCITFVEQDVHRTPPYSLEDMLRTRTIWAPYEAPSAGLEEDRFCIVSEGFYHAFPLLPARASFFLADIASRLQLSFSQIALTPASPSPIDVCLYGRACRNIIGVSTLSAYSGAAAVRIAARAFGQPWPHQPQHGRFAIVVDALRPALHLAETAVTLAVCVLTPGHLKEVVSIYPHPDDTIDSLISELRQVRDADKHRLYPFIEIPRVQPHSHWLLAFAFPSWAVVDRFVVFDLTSVDARFFVETVPVTLSRQVIFDIVRLPLAPALHIYIDEDAEPLPGDIEFPAQTGMLISLRPATAGRPPVFPVGQVLHTARPGEPHPVDLPSPAGRHLCIVTEHGHSVFSVADGQNPPSPMALPSLLGHPSGSRICPSYRQPADVEVFGFPCSAVLAIVSPSDDDSPYACIFDARGLLQGWTMLPFGEEGLPIEEAFTLLETFMPPHWQLHLEGADAEAGHFCCYDGHVIRASFVPETPDIASDGYDTDDADHESFADAFPPPSPEPSDTSSDHDMSPGDNPTPRRSRSPRRGNSPPGAAFRSHAHIDRPRLAAPRQRAPRHSAPFARPTNSPPRLRLQCLMCFLLLAPVQGGMQNESLPDPTACMGTFHSAHCHHSGFEARPLPTPLRNARHDFGAACASLPAESSPERTLIDGPFHTLLQESLADPQCPAMFLAATLLDTLFEHFAATSPVSTSGPWPDSPPRHISLSDCLVPTAHQRQCLALEKELPHTFDVDEAPDWLDNDLTALLRNSCISLELRTSFVNLRCWHAEGCPRPSRLSIYTDGSASSDPSDLRPASWAFAVFAQAKGLDYLVGHASSVTAPPCSAYHLGETRDDALTGELLALCWGLAWTAQYGSSFNAPVDFYYDSQCAGGGVFGISRSPTGADPAAYTRLASCAIALRQYTSARAAVQHAYVPSHAGHIGNELADGLAKTARAHISSHDDCALPLWVSRFSRHRLKDWAWAMVPGHTDLPRPYVFETEAARAQLDPPTPVEVPTQGLQTHCLPAADATYNLCCVSFNALTLKDPKAKGAPAAPLGLRLAGRKAILKQSLSDTGPHLVGLQETRLQASDCQPDEDYYIFNAEADAKGHGGCALWLSEHRPFGSCRGQSLVFQERDVTVVSTSHRHVTANVLAPRLRLHVQVVHAPSVPTSGLSAVRAFWSERAKELAHRPSGTDFVLLCDANSRLGSTVSMHVGDKHPDSENDAGTLFHEFLAQISAFVPSTFSDFQQGPGDTWCSPCGKWSRIDYIVLPLAWQFFDITASTLPDAETLQKRDDHIPVLSRVSFARTAPATSYSVNVRKAVRPAMPQTPQDRLSARNRFATVAAVPWSLHVDVHHRQLTDAWTQAWTDTAPEDVATRPRQPFLSADTLSVVQLRKALRQYLRHEQRERHRRILLIAFAAFRLHTEHTGLTAQAVAAADRWFRHMDCSEAQALCALHLSTKTIRRKVAADRAQYLSGLATQAMSCTLRDPWALYQAVRRAFPSARPSRRSAFKPLPSLLLADGTRAASFEDRNEGWRAHFAMQEAGDKIAPADYTAHFFTYRRKPAWSFDVSVVPSLRQIETVIHSLQTHKAVGSDSVSAELLRTDVPAASRQLLPVLAKAAIRVFEPVAFRGGDLFLLAKRASKVLGCDAYRSILISSVPGKIYHRCLRQQLLPAFDQTRHPLHASIMPGQGIELISIAAKTFFSLCNNTGRKAALVFFDLKAAFYQVVRQLLVDTQDSDEELLVLFHKLGLPPSATAELKEKLSGILLLEGAGVSAHARALVTDLFQGTYFRLTTDTAITLTRRGTRPGDPAADLLFAFTLSAYIAAATKALAGRNLLADLPSPSSRPPGVKHHNPVDLQCPAWADDFFFPQTGAAFPDLLDRVSSSTTLLTEHASSLGMTVKFGEDKTAAMLPAELLAKHAALLTTNSEGALGLSLRDATCQTQCFLPAVHTYKHLGGILTSDSNPSPDLHFRYAQSMGVVRPLRRKLFGDLRFELPVRRTLLRSLAVSRYVHTAAAMLLHATVHKRLWERQYLSLWRVLVARHAVDAQAHSYEVLRQGQAASPALALASARASCLRKLFTVGPSNLLALLWDHWALHPKSSWLAQLHEDVQHVAVYCPTATACLGSPPYVAGLIEAFESDPYWWPTQVKAATRLFLRDLEEWRAARKAASRMPPHIRANTSDSYACYLCTSTFPLRKHLHAHLARAHHVYSPARHYALSEVCPCCLRVYPDVLLAQLHLKRQLKRQHALLPEPSSADTGKPTAPKVLQDVFRSPSGLGSRPA